MSRGSMFLGKLKALGTLALMLSLLAAAVTLAFLARAEALQVTRKEKPPAAPDGIGEKRPSKGADFSTRIEGLVVDESEKPVAGAVVRNLEAENERTTTGADGGFLLELDAPAISRQTVVATDAAEQRHGLFSFIDGGIPLANHTTIRIVLRPCRHLTVHVTGADKKPLQGAAVTIFHQYAPLTQALSDAQGLATLRFPADATIWWVVALKAGAGFDYFENYRSSPASQVVMPPPPADVHLSLEGARKVSIRTLDSSDRAVPDVELQPWFFKKKGKISYVNIAGSKLMKRQGWTSPADGQGNVIFDWIPHDLEGGITFLSPSRDYHLPQPPTFDPSNEGAKLTARFLRNVCVEGKVTYAGGQPAAGILVQAEGRGGSSHYCRTLGRTKADGTYRVQLYPDQTYVLAVTGDSWAAPSHTGFRVQEGEPLGKMDFVLRDGTLIRGKVTVGPKDRPAENQTVTLIESEKLVRWASSDKGGSYQFRVGPGSYQISGPGTQQEQLAVENEGEISHDFHMDRLPRVGLKGMVRSKEGRKPIAGAIVYGEPVSVNGHAGFEARADAKGRFQVERWNDELTLYAHDPTGDRAGTASLSEDSEEIVLDLSPAAQLKGRLLDGAGKPVVGIKLTCWLSSSVEPGAKRSVSLHSETGADGSFKVTGLIPGLRWKIVDNRNGNGTEIADVEIKEARMIDLGDLVPN